jgi:hypothetical protein
MKILKRILIVFVVLILVLCVISLFLPSKVRVERSMQINAPSEVVFEQVNTLRNWEAWSPWQKMDPTSQMVYNDIPSGAGASYSWKGDKTGEGSLTIAESRPNDLIITNLDFKGQGQSTGGFEIKPEGAGVNLNWYMDMDNGMNPFAKYMSMMMKGMLKDQFDEGLTNIKQISESMPKKPETNPMPAPADTVVQQ